jgi:DUF971 family protein
MQIQRLPQPMDTANHIELPQEGLIVWDQKGVVVVWSDGHRSRLLWTALRAACPCAECRGQQGGTAEPSDLHTAR